MKKLLSLIAGFFLSIALYASSCTPPDGYSFRQRVAIYNQSGQRWDHNADVFHANNACDAFCVCFTYAYGDSSICYVSKSDKSGYGYMFWYNGSPFYFNM